MSRLVFDRNSAEAYDYQARCYLAEGGYKQALKSISKSIEIKNTAQALAIKGVIQREMGDLEEAVKTMAKVVGITIAFLL